MELNGNNITNSANQEDLAKQKGPKKSAGRAIGLVFLVLILMAGSGYGGYWYRERGAKKSAKSADQQIAELQKQKKELEDAKAKAEQEAKEAKEAKQQSEQTSNKTTPSTEVKNNIQDAIKSGNTSALEGYMASTVKVILAASEGMGNRTPTQAISDLKYLDAGTDPWNFSVPSASLTAWRAGFYKQYFPDGAVIGESANHYVVSFSFDSAGKINTIFMTGDASGLN